MTSLFLNWVDSIWNIYYFLNVFRVLWAFTEFIRIAILMLIRNVKSRKKNKIVYEYVYASIRWYIVEIQKIYMHEWYFWRVLYPKSILNLVQVKYQWVKYTKNFYDIFIFINGFRNDTSFSSSENCICFRLFYSN